MKKLLSLSLSFFVMLATAVSLQAQQLEEVLSAYADADLSSNGYIVRNDSLINISFPGGVLQETLVTYVQADILVADGTNWSVASISGSDVSIQTNLGDFYATNITSVVKTKTGFCLIRDDYSQALVYPENYTVDCSWMNALNLQNQTSITFGFAEFFGGPLVSFKNSSSVHYKNGGVIDIGTSLSLVTYLDVSSGSSSSETKISISGIFDSFGSGSKIIYPVSGYSVEGPGISRFNFIGNGAGFTTRTGGAWFGSNYIQANQLVVCNIENEAPIFQEQLFNPQNTNEFELVNIDGLNGIIGRFSVQTSTGFKSCWPLAIEVAMTTSTNTIEGDVMRKLSHFPNPAITTTTIQLESTQAFDSSLIVTSAIGQTVANYKWPISAGINNFLLDVSDYIPGNYFYSIVTPSELVTKQLIVVR